MFLVVKIAYRAVNKINSQSEDPSFIYHRFYNTLLNHLTVSEEMIRAIDRLRKNRQNEVSDNEELYTTNPMIEIITPEWYYSDSFRLFENASIKWNDLDRIEFIHQMAENVQKADNETRIGIEFEKSFCSWYESYHYLPRTKWGIHIRYSSWLITAARFNKSCPLLTSRSLDSVKAAFLYLFNHGLFHHLTNNASSLTDHGQIVPIWIHRKAGVVHCPVPLDV